MDRQTQEAPQKMGREDDVVENSISQCLRCSFALLQLTFAGQRAASQPLQSSFIVDFLPLIIDYHNPYLSPLSLLEKSIEGQTCGVPASYFSGLSIREIAML